MTSFTVVGMKFRGFTPADVVSTYSESKLTLEPEPTNQFDANAIKVLVDGKHMGYVAKEHCPNVKQYLTSHPTPVFNVIERYSASVNVAMNALERSDVLTNIKA